MKNYLLLFALLGLTLISCKDDDAIVDADYNVAIIVEQPTVNLDVNVNEEMNVKVNYERTGEDNIIHHVFVLILDDAGNTVDELLTQHVHQEGSYVFENVYTPTTTGTYTLKAMSHDMDENHTTPVEVTFTVN